MYHKTVLLNEAVSSLNLFRGAVAVDCTLGGGGHSEKILEIIGPDGLLVGFDKDPEAIEEAGKRLSRFDNKILVNSDFAEIKSELALRGIKEVNAVLFDLGVSGHQLDADRGFSFLRDEKLDMRMSRSGKTAADYVNSLPEDMLADVIYKYGEEKFSRRVASAICQYRQKKYISSTLELSEIIAQKIGWAYKKEKIHPATRTFQAIRILVNDELSSVEKGVQDAIDLLAGNGVISVISFHSLEDRIVKNIFRYNSGRCKCPPGLPVCVCGAAEKIKTVTKKPLLPTEEEIRENPRASSSKLRIGIKI